MSKYPEHDKLAQITDESNVIGAFLDYGLAEQGLVVAEEGDRYSGRLRLTHKSIPDILARYFDIDQGKIDKEKGQMLDKLAEMNKKESVTLSYEGAIRDVEISEEETK